MKILLLEDDVILNEIIEEHLMAQGYEVSSFFDGILAQDALYSNSYDILLLDVNVPNLSGFELLKQLRNDKIMTPAIFITSLDMVDDIEKGFQAGCDDYIKKPFELKELNLRISNIKRLFKLDATNEISLDNNVTIDTKLCLIKKGQESTHITSKELEVLLYLLNNENRIISIEELSSNVWSYEASPSSTTIRTYIKNIRKALNNESIVNIRGVGYQFNIK